jgi:hypothetical protein
MSPIFTFSGGAASASETNIGPENNENTIRAIVNIVIFLYMAYLL